MEKNIKDFLNYLEKETSISFDISTMSPTQKILNSINRPVLINVLGINECTLGLTVISCDCKSCKEIIGVEILYGENGSELFDAQQVQNQIETAVPSIPVGLRNVRENE
jgi:hypothetical protein